MTGTPDTEVPESKWWDTVRVFYPYLSVLVFGPACLAFGWHWPALAFAAVGVVVVAKWFGWRSCVSLPVLVANTLETLLAVWFIVRDWRDRLPLPPEVAS
jgi:hypothetical protein